MEANAVFSETATVPDGEASIYRDAVDIKKCTETVYIMLQHFSPDKSLQSKCV